MKGIFKVLGIIALVGFIGFGLSACKDPEDNSLPALTGTVSITGTAQVGETLTADTSALGGSGVISFQWKSGGGTVIGSASTYTVLNADVGSAISLTVTRSGNSGSITSPSTNTVPPQLIGTVSITGTAQVGQTLTANITNLDGDGLLSYQWQRDGNVIGTNSATYIVQTDDVGSIISVIVTRAGYSGSITGTLTDTPIFSSLTGTVSIIGNAWVGETLTADTTALDGSGTISYQWRRGSNNIGTNSSTYIVQSTDLGSIILVIVTRSENSEDIMSNPTSSVILPPLTGTVNITGTPQVGQILMANTTSLGGSGIISYQWRRGTTNIGTNSNTYALQLADVGLAITVTVTRDGNSGSVTSDPAEDVTLPPLTGSVNITGNAIVGQVLTANTDSLGGNGTIFYQWRRDGTNIGSNSSSYIVQSLDVGSTITVTVTRSSFSGSVLSDPTSTVMFPVLTGTVSISGTAQVGQMLTANTTGLGGSGTISYQWMRDGITFIGTNSSTYIVQDGDVSSTITVVVTRANNSSSITSNPTLTIIFPPLTGTVNIIGNAWVGETLTADTTALGGSGAISYQWKCGGTNVGSNSATYIVQSIDTGSSITVTVIRANNSNNITSNSTSTVILPPLTGTVNITGTAHVGQALTANIANLGGSGTISYQWMRNGINIGTNSSTYTVQTADVDSVITVEVTRVNNSGSVTSASTASVPSVLTGTVSITGIAQVGQTLTVNTTNLGGSGTISYQWMSGTINVGTNSTMYIISNADVGSSITVTVTRANNSGSVTSEPTEMVVILPLTGTVSIAGNAHVGQTLTANTESLGGSGTISYQWMSNGTNNIGTNNNTYIIQDNDVGSIITVTVTRANNLGSVTSDPTETIIFPPLTGTVSINGNPYVGQVLRANVNSLGGSGAISYQWMSNGTNNIGTNNNTYIIQDNDVGSDIIVIVTRANNSSSIASPPTLIRDGLLYQLINGGTEYSVSAFFTSSTSTAVVIPAIYNGLPVTAIGNNAFESAVSLTSITIPNSVTSIGTNAFSNSGLISITIPDSVTSIGQSAFFNCRSLASVTLGNSVANIGHVVFRGCTSLTSITIPNSVISIGQSAFENSGLTSIIIPKSVTYINPSAFLGCTSLTSIVVENGNTVYRSEGNCVIQNNMLIIGIKTSVIPTSVTSIGNAAFSGCTGLTSITIPNSVTFIYSSAFINSGLTSIIVENGNTVYRSEGNCVIRNNILIIGIKTSVIPTSVTSIGQEAFVGRTGLTSITIPNSVIRIGEKAFIGCTGLTSITIPNSVTSIGYDAFVNTGIWNNSPNNDVVYVDKWVVGFKGQINGNLIIKTGTTGIGDGVFSNAGLTSVIIPNSVTSIGVDAFSACSGLTSVTLGTITAPNFNNFSFRGNLREVYFAAGGGAGTYTTTNPVANAVWVKE